MPHAGYSNPLTDKSEVEFKDAFSSSCGQAERYPMVSNDFLPMLRPCFLLTPSHIGWFVIHIKVRRQT